MPDSTEDSEQRDLHYVRNNPHSMLSDIKTRQGTVYPTVSPTALITVYKAKFLFMNNFIHLLKLAIHSEFTVTFICQNYAILVGLNISYACYILWEGKDTAVKW